MLDGGGYFIDTAKVYGLGQSERIIGRAIKGIRDEVIIATKVGGPMSQDPADKGLSRRHILEQVDASLEL